MTEPVSDEGDQLINGRYRLAEVIGRGGMGTVWRGHDEMLDREVAVKRLSFDPGLDDEKRAELAGLAIREARAAARLNHPGIVTIFDVIDDDGAPVIVMEFVDGRSLGDILREEVRLPYRRVAEIGAAVLDALREAHAAGIVHRDLKPGNILITDRRVVITDFGVAERVGERSGDGEDVLGTPAFMAPEQTDNAAASPAADLWSLGATLFNAVEGKPPFEGPDYATILLTLLTQEAPAPVNAGPLAPLITALLRKDPERRPSAEDAAARLTAILDGGDSPAPLRTPVPTPAQPSDTAPPSEPAEPSDTAPPSDMEQPSDTDPAPMAAGAFSPTPAKREPRPTPEEWVPVRPQSASGPAPARRVPFPGTQPPPHYVPPAPARDVWAVRAQRRRYNRVAVAIVVAVVVIPMLFEEVLLNVVMRSLHPLPEDPPARQPSAGANGPGFWTAAFSPDGRTVAFGGSSGLVRLYDAVTRRPTHLTASTDYPVISALSFSPNGRTVAIGLAKGGIEAWDLGNGTVRPLPGLAKEITALRFSADGQTLTAIDTDCALGTWSLRAGATPKPIRQHPPVESSAFQRVLPALSQDGKLAACPGNGLNLVVWSIQRARRVASLPVTVQNFGLAFDPDGKTLAVDAGPPGRDDVQLWSIARRKRTLRLHTPLKDGEDVLTFSQDGTMLAIPTQDAHGRNTVELRRTSDGTRIATLASGVQEVNKLTFSPKGDLLAVAYQGGGQLWSVRSRTKLASWND